MNEKQIDLVSHSLGINYYNAKLSTEEKYKYLPVEFYRNYYNYSVFCEDMKQLEELGIIEKFSALKLTCFSVTDYGIAEFRKVFTEEVTDKYFQNSISKSKKNYSSWLHSDCGLTFAEYIGIHVPKKERYGKLIRFVSTRYYDVKGDFKTTVSEAKESYKKHLNRKKSEIHYSYNH